MVEFDEAFKIISYEEKPVEPKNNYAVIVLCFYPEGISAKANAV